MSWEYTNATDFTNATQTLYGTPSLYTTDPTTHVITAKDAGFAAEIAALQNYSMKNNLNPTNDAEYTTMFNSFIKNTSPDGGGGNFWDGTFTVGSSSVPKLWVYGGGAGLVLLFLMRR